MRFSEESLVLSALSPPLMYKRQSFNRKTKQNKTLRKFFKNHVEMTTISNP